MAARGESAEGGGDEEEEGGLHAGVDQHTVTGLLLGGAAMHSVESFGVRCPGKPGFEQRGVGLHAGARKPGGPRETILGPKKNNWTN